MKISPELELKDVGNALVEESRTRTRQSDRVGNAFLKEAQRLTGALESIYKMVVLDTRKEEDLDIIVRWWDGMECVCDVVMNRLSELEAHQPQSEREEVFNYILDLKNKCQRLKEMHS